MYYKLQMLIIEKLQKKYFVSFIGLGHEERKIKEEVEPHIRNTSRSILI